MKYQEVKKTTRKKRQQVCLHKGCPECRGTGRKADGSTCIHMISCPCPKCNPYRL